MRQIKMTLSVGLVFLLGLALFGESPRSYAQSAGFITSKPISSWGTIVGTKDTVVNLSKGEVVYVQLQPGKAIKPGDRFTVLQLGQTIIHPVTKEEIGQLVTQPGELVILEGKDQIATAKIHESLKPILRGDHILTPAPIHAEAVPMRSLKKIEGRIIFSQEGIENISSNEFVFIDRGSQDGVILGALFKIYQMSNDFDESLKEDPSRLPLSKVGKAVVVSVQDKTSAALITLSSQAIRIGDQAISGPE